MHGPTCLIDACAANQTDRAILLLQSPDIRVDVVDRYGRTALMCAVMNDMRTVVEALCRRQGHHLNHRNSLGENALIIACLQRKPECAAILLRTPNVALNAVLYSDNITALMAACENGMNDIVALFCTKEGLDVNCVSRYGKKTALMLSQNKICRELISDYKKRHRIALLPEEFEHLFKLKNSCSICPGSKPFTFFNSRHHCRACGAPVCAQHSAMIPISSHGGSAMRYCQTCVPAPIPLPPSEPSAFAPMPTPWFPKTPRGVGL